MSLTCSPWVCVSLALEIWNDDQENVPVTSSVNIDRYEKFYVLPEGCSVFCVWQKEKENKKQNVHKIRMSGWFLL